MHGHEHHLYRTYATEDACPLMHITVLLFIWLGEGGNILPICIYVVVPFVLMEKLLPHSKLQLNKGFRPTEMNHDMY